MGSRVRDRGNVANGLVVSNTLVLGEALALEPVFKAVDGGRARSSGFEKLDRPVEKECWRETVILGCGLAISDCIVKAWIGVVGSCCCWDGC